MDDNDNSFPHEIRGMALTRCLQLSVVLLTIWVTTGVMARRPEVDEPDGASPNAPPTTEAANGRAHRTTQSEQQSSSSQPISKWIPHDDEGH